jgi:hypothetical protein
VVLAGCALGGPIGREASLEVEIALVDGQLRQTAEQAFGPYTVIGTFVGVDLCSPDNRYAAHVNVRIRPDALPMDQARQAALDWVARSGSTLTGNKPGWLESPVFFDAQPNLVGAGFSFSLGRVPGVELGKTTGCYEPGRVQADNPFDLSVETGIRLDYRP